MKIVYKMHPLPSHQWAQRAAQAALAAAAQGRFMEMHELLFQRYRQFNQLGSEKAAGLGLSAEQRGSGEVQDAVFTDLAMELGLDINAFVEAYGSDAVKKQITEETREVMAVGASGTPASFVNGKYLRGAQPFEAFKAKVDEALRSGTTARKAAP